jgi:hypothetical protein
MMFKKWSTNQNLLGDTTQGLRYIDPIHSPSNITAASTIWYLGIYLNHDLSWKNHMDIMANRTRSTIRGISILGNTISGLDLLNWHKVYNALVIPILTYGAQVWHMGCNQKGLVHKLQVAQNKGIRKIGGIFKTTPINLLYNLLSVLPISYVLPKLMHSYALRLQGLPPNSKVRTVLDTN